MLLIPHRFEERVVVAIVDTREELLHIGQVSDDGDHMWIQDHLLLEGRNE